MTRGRLPAIFVAVVVAPALVLAAAAFRGLSQERARVRQEIAARAVERLEETLDRLVAGREEPPDGAVLLEARGGQVTWRPAEALAFRPGMEPLPSTVPEELDSARGAAPEEALRLYRGARPRHPQWSLLLEGRLLKQLGRTEEAAAVWRALAELPDARVGAVPSRFVARLELGGAGLWEEMEAGRWAELGRAQYFYYREVLGGAVRPLGAKARLALAAATFLSAPKGELEGGVVAWWETDGSGLRAMLAPREVLAGAIWKRAGGPPASLVDGDEGEAVRRLPGRWRVRAGDADSPELAAFDRQQQWLQGLLGLALVAGCAGGFFVFRAVRREMEMAERQAEFVAAVSHEFRTPLAGVRQLVTLLERDRVPDEGRRQEYYAMMGRECARLTRLVDNVLDFSRMETGRKEYRMEEIETAAFLREVAAEFGHAGAPVEAAIPEGLPRLRGDREALATAVRNLLDNAVKYGGKAWLEAETRGRIVAIRVRDEGPGIAPEEQGRIFERFYRTPGDGARRVKGVGLGLALVKRIVEAHVGTVRVESELGKGSVFTIELEGGGR